jgi:CTP:molybdopterin cytidylyltransferase MocA
VYIHAILLAAGESKRFGSPKQLAQIKMHLNGETKQLITISSEAVLDAQFNSYLIMLGANAEQIKNLVPKHLSFDVNKDWRLGMGATIAKAMQSIPEQTSHVCITLADQVKLTTLDFNRLINAAKQNPHKIIAAYFNNKAGAPCIFPRHYFANLANFTGDKGARDLLQNEDAHIVKIDLPEAAIDVDTLDDLHAINDDVDAFTHKTKQRDA